MAQIVGQTIGAEASQEISSLADYRAAQYAAQQQRQQFSQILGQTASAFGQAMNDDMESGASSTPYQNPTNTNSTSPSATQQRQQQNTNRHSFFGGTQQTPDEGNINFQRQQTALSTIGYAEYLNDLENSTGLTVGDVLTTTPATTTVPTPYQAQAEHPILYAKVLNFLENHPDVVNFIEQHQTTFNIATSTTNALGGFANGLTNLPLTSDQRQMYRHPFASAYAFGNDAGQFIQVASLTKLGSNLLGKGIAFFRGEAEISKIKLTPEEQLNEVLQQSKVYQQLKNVPASSPNAAQALQRKLSLLEDFQNNADKIEVSSSGSIRYYDEFRPAKKPGPTVGSRFVTEYNPKTGDVSSWNETYDSLGNVNRVHLKNINGILIESPHFPATLQDKLNEQFFPRPKF